MKMVLHKKKHNIPQIHSNLTLLLYCMMSSGVTFFWIRCSSSGRNSHFLT